MLYSAAEAPGAANPVMVVRANHGMFVNKTHASPPRPCWGRSIPESSAEPVVGGQPEAKVAMATVK